MLNIGDLIYRFSFQVIENELKVKKHTFKVSKIKEPDFSVGKFAKTKYKLECLEDKKIIYKSGQAVRGCISEADIKFDQPQCAGKAIYVTLHEDDAFKAKSLAKEVIETRIEILKVKLNAEETLLKAF